jgi:hypothetical protein
MDERHLKHEGTDWRIILKLILGNASVTIGTQIELVITAWICKSRGGCGIRSPRKKWREKF